MTKQIERILSKPNVNIEAVEKLASIAFQKQDKTQWDNDRQDEYDLLYPRYRVETYEEYADRLTSLNLSIVEKDFYLAEAINIEIDYSEDDTYVTYNDWINETKVIQEFVEAEYVEGLEKIASNLIRAEIKEVTELVRPYTSKDITERVVSYITSQYSVLRAGEYPDVTEYMDAIVKDDTVAIQAYKDKYSKGQKCP